MYNLLQVRYLICKMPLNWEREGGRGGGRGEAAFNFFEKKRALNLNNNYGVQRNIMYTFNKCHVDDNFIKYNILINFM